MKQLRDVGPYRGHSSRGRKNSTHDRASVGPPEEVSDKRRKHHYSAAVRKAEGCCRGIEQPKIVAAGHANK